MFTRRIRHEKSRRTIYDWFSFRQLRNELMKMRKGVNKNNTMI
jgi:hypothetical protein